MMPMIYIFLGLIGLVIIIAMIWRFSSQRTSIPCPTWLSWLVELDNPFLKNNSAREIIKHLDLQPGMKVLDLGCGPGRLTIPAAKQVGPQGAVTAFDIQPGMLHRTQTKAREASLDNIQFVQGGAGEGKLGHHEYDRVLLVTVLGEIPDREIAMKEVFDALKPGGILSVTEVIADPHFQSRESVRRTANLAGFVERGFFGSRIAFTLNFEKP